MSLPVDGALLSFMMENRELEGGWLDVGHAFARDVAALASAMGGVTVVRKGPIDVASDGKRAVYCCREGAPRRCGGQGDVLTGAIGTVLAWAGIHRKNQMDKAKKNKGGEEGGGGSGGEQGKEGGKGDKGKEQEKGEEGKQAGAEKGVDKKGGGDGEMQDDAHAVYAEEGGGVRRVVGSLRRLAAGEEERGVGVQSARQVDAGQPCDGRHGAGD